MAFIRKKTINGKVYQYEVKSVREGAKVSQVHIRYVGKDGEPVPKTQLRNDYLRPKSWHTRRERELITLFGGKVKKGPGYDGEIKGRPVEVRLARKDNRFRIQKDTHQVLMKGQGYYIFESPGRDPVLIRAKDIDKTLPPGAWFEDRGYSHKFITVADLWGGD